MTRPLLPPCRSVPGRGAPWLPGVRGRLQARYRSLGCGSGRVVGPRAALDRPRVAGVPADSNRDSRDSFDSPPVAASAGIRVRGGPAAPRSGSPSAAGEAPTAAECGARTAPEPANKRPSAESRSSRRADRRADGRRLTRYWPRATTSRRIRRGHGPGSVSCVAYRGRGIALWLGGLVAHGSGPGS